jgi:hypothetical protein
MLGNYNGWNNKSGKKRLNSIKIPAVNVIQTAAKTGALDKNLVKFGMNYLQDVNREFVTESIVEVE